MKIASYKYIGGFFMRELQQNEMAMLNGGEVLTLSAVLTVLVVAIIAVVCYRLFMSGEGSVSLPGGYKFTWESCVFKI